MPERLAVEAERTADRLRTMTLARLGRGAPSPADLAHALAQRLADIAADAEGRPRRALPRLGDECAGDQIAVTAYDVLRAAPGRDVIDECADALVELRRAV